MIEIWTDGASRGNPGLGACGFYCIDDNNLTHSRVYAFEKSTNNRMEVGAIISALKFATHCRWFDQDIKIYSDSAWAIGAVSKNWNITCNLDLVNKARDLVKTFKNLEFIKVKGHSDNEGNIAIDTLLNEVMDCPNKLYVDKGLNL